MKNQTVLPTPQKNPTNPPKKTHTQKKTQTHKQLWQEEEEIT